MSSVSQSLDSLGALVLRHPRCLESYTPRHIDTSSPFEPCAAAPLMPHSPMLQHPRCLESYKPRLFDASRPFEPHASAPLVVSVPRCSTTSVPQCFGALRSPPLGASTPRGILSCAHCYLGGLGPMHSIALVSLCFDTLGTFEDCTPHRFDVSRSCQILLATPSLSTLHVQEHSHTCLHGGSRGGRARTARTVSGTLLQISGFQGQALGRSLAGLVVPCKQLWLSQTRVPDADKSALLDAPISPGNAFGPAVEEILQCSHREQEVSRQVAAILPSHASARGRGGDGVRHLPQ
ncbi:UNVERIFIED_CONTAM: hypothetical protein FKN15_048901 [Acipenser sinensis]